jgi:hypothetical protein
LTLRVEVLEQDVWRLSQANVLRSQSQEVPRLSNHFSELIAVIGLRGGSRMICSLSGRGLANVAVRDWSHNFTFIIGDHRYWCRSFLAQFLSPQVSKLHSIDGTIDELRLEIEDGDELFGSVLEAAGSGNIAVEMVHRRIFMGICGALWNSDLYKAVCGQIGDDIIMENVGDHLRFLSATRCDISTEIDFIASHFDDFLCRCDAIAVLPLSLLYEILGHGSLRLESEDGLYGFISDGIKTHQELFDLMEFV